MEGSSSSSPKKGTIGETVDIAVGDVLERTDKGI
jgi:hypothetical protein